MVGINNCNYFHRENLKMKTKIKILAGIIISVFFVYLSMKDVVFIKMWEAFLQVNFYYYVFIILGVYLTYVLKTLRWQILLSPLKKISYKTLYPTLLISFMLLIIMPARLGEFARAYLVGRKENISKTGAFSSIVIERILDGCIAILFFIIAVSTSPQSSNISILFEKIAPLSATSQSVFSTFMTITTNYNSDPNKITMNLEFKLMHLIYFIAFFYLAALFFVVLLKILKRRIVDLILKILFFLPEKIRNSIEEMLESFILGLECLSNFKNLLASVFYSFMIWGIVGAYTYLMLISFPGLEEIKFYIAFIIVGFTVIGVMIPAAPGFIGTFHIVVMIAFKYYIPQADKNVAGSFAWVCWAIGTFYTIFVGLYHLKKEGLSIKSISDESKTNS